MMGAKLAALVVCKHMWAVFRVHRRALKNNVEYCATDTSQSSGLMLMEVAGDSATEDDDGTRNASTVLSEIQPLNTGLHVYSRHHKVPGPCPEICEKPVKTNLLIFYLEYE